MHTTRHVLAHEAVCDVLVAEIAGVVLRQPLSGVLGIELGRRELHGGVSGRL